MALLLFQPPWKAQPCGGPGSTPERRSLAPENDRVDLIAGNAAPTTSSAVTFAPGLTRSNNAIVPLAGSGSGALGIYSSAAVPVHVTIDVYGYFQ